MTTTTKYPGVTAMNSDDEGVVPSVLCGMRKKQNKPKKQKLNKESLLEENVKLKEIIRQLETENQKLKTDAEEKNKQIIAIVDYTVNNITDCKNVVTGDNNTVIDTNPIESLKECVELICAELAESSKEHAQTTFHLKAVERIVHETHNKVECLSIDNTVIQSKLVTIENLLDVGKSRTWDELQLEKAIHAVKDWVKNRSSDARITYAMLPVEGKRLVERLTVMYGLCLHRFMAALGISSDTMYVGKTSHSEDVCAESFVRWICDDSGNTAAHLYDILTNLDKELIEEQERKIREKAAKRRSYLSVDRMSQKSSQASNGDLCFEENYF